MVNRFKPFIPAILWAGIILILSTLPGKDMPQVDLINADKLFHAGCYGIFTLLLIRGFAGFQSTRPLLISALIAIAYGFGMEAIQGLFFPDRFFDLWDGLANTIGAIGAIILWPMLFKK